MNEAGICVFTLRRDYSAHNIAVLGGWVELSSSLPENIRRVQIFDGGGYSMQLGYGPSGAEVVAIDIPPGGIDTKQILNKGMRLVYKAIGGDATSNELLINAYR